MCKPQNRIDYQIIMRKPSLEDYSLSKELYELLSIEQSDDEEKQYKLIRSLLENRKKKLASNLSILLTILIISVAIYFLIITDNKWWIVGVLMLSELIFLGVAVLINYIIELIQGEGKISTIIWFYTSVITKKDRLNYKKYNEDLSEFYTIPVSIPWSDIVLKNKEVTFIVNKFESEYSITDDRSEEIYEDYKQLVIDLLPAIYVYLEDGLLKISNEEDFNKAIEIIKSRYEQDRQLINTYNSTSQEIIRARIKNRSFFLDYLLEKQIKGLGIIKDHERIEHSSSRGTINYEDAYIFTLLSAHSNHYIVVYENVNNDKSTIVCDVDVADYSMCIKTLISYMGRERVINRREKLHRDPKIKDFPIRHAYHNDRDSWYRMIMRAAAEKRQYKGYVVIKKTTKRRKRSWKRWY